jgi:ribonuclease PH
MTTKTRPPEESGPPSRTGKRAPDEIRPILIRTDYFENADGSAYIEMGKTKVAAAATLDDRVPPFLKNTGTGWVTAEYSMLPCATERRTPRERMPGKVSGRTHEIQRLIGRALRSVTDLAAIGETTVLVDCDVLQADGGTRASPPGASPWPWP